MAPSRILDRDLRDLEAQLRDLATHLEGDCQPLCQCVVLDLVRTLEVVIAKVDRLDGRVQENREAISELERRQEVAPYQSPRL